MDRRTAIKQSAMVMGITMSGTVFSSILQGCKTETPEGYVPVAHSADHFKLISAICDKVIPTTDTPGALDLLVDRFVDQYISVTFDDKQKEDWVNGLNNLGEKLSDSSGKPFYDLGDDQQVELLEGVDANMGDNPEYSNLKGIIVGAYVNTEEVGEKILSYDPIPGKYVACLPLSEVGNTWSLK